MKELLKKKDFKEYEVTDDYIRYKKDSTSERWWFLYHFQSKESTLDRYLLEKCKENRNVYYFAEVIYEGTNEDEITKIINDLD